MKRQEEIWEKIEMKKKNVVAKNPKFFFPQERDWTCSIACIRTILSGITDTVPTENEFIDVYNLSPGPYYSKDIKSKQLLEHYEVLYGCDAEIKAFEDLLEYMEQGFFVMLESMYNYAHWMVLLGYYPFNDCDLENAKLLMYDPYYNNVRLLNVDEFLTMWIDGNHATNGIKKDFIAIR